MSGLPGTCGTFGESVAGGCRDDGARPTLGIVIVNWNSGELLRRCVASLVASLAETESELDAHVIVVDNASTDDSMHHLPSLDAKVSLVESRTNLGFGAACNRGVRAAPPCKYWLFLNPDTVVTGASLREPVRFMESEEGATFSVCGIQLRAPDGAVQRHCAWLPTTTTMLSHSTGLRVLSEPLFGDYIVPLENHYRSAEVDHVIGAFYLIRAGVFASLCGFDERYFVYFEDLDLSCRARAAGYRVYYLASAWAEHLGGGVSAQVKGRRLFYSICSRLQYSHAHLPRCGALIATAVSVTIEPFLRYARALLKAAPDELRATAWAYRALVRLGARRLFAGRISRLDVIEAARRQDGLC